MATRPPVVPDEWEDVTEVWEDVAAAPPAPARESFGLDRATGISETPWYDREIPISPTGAKLPFTPRQAVDAIPAVAAGLASLHPAGQTITGAAMLSGAAGGAGEAWRQNIRRAMGLLSPETPVEAAKDIVVEGGIQGVLGGTGQGLGMAGGRLTRSLKPAEATTPVTQVAREIGLPVSDPAGGIPLRRPSEGYIANIFARHQEPRVLKQAAGEINKELTDIGAPLVEGTPPSKGTLLKQTRESIQQTAASRAKDAAEGLAADRSKAAANLRAEKAARAARRAGEKNASAARAAESERVMAAMDESAAASRSAELAAAEKRVRDIFGESGGIQGDEAIRARMLTSKQAKAKEFGAGFDKALEQFRGTPVDATSLLSQVDEMAATQGNIPMVQQARAELASYRILDEAGNPTNMIPAEKIRMFSEKYGGLRVFNPTRNQGAAFPLRRSAEESLEQGLAGREGFADYEAAKTAYATDFAPDYRRGIVPRVLKNEQQPQMIVAAAAKARKSPKEAKAILRALTDTGEGAELQSFRAALVERDLLANGIEDFPKRLASYDPDVLSMYFGAADAKGLKTISEHASRLTQKPVPMKSQLGPSTPLAIPAEPPIARPSFPTKAPSVAEFRQALTSERLTHIIEALQSAQRPLSGWGGAQAVARPAAAIAAGAAFGPRAAIGVLTGAELHGLMATAVAYHPKGTLAKLGRGLNLLASGSPRPLIQTLTEMARQQKMQENQAAANQGGNR